MKRIGIVNVNLEYEIPEGENPEEYLQNVELPKQYVDESYEFVKVVEEHDEECDCLECNTCYHCSKELGVGSNDCPHCSNELKNKINKKLYEKQKRK